MNELKTLEDIPIPNRTFTRRILKAEAVKWVKHFGAEMIYKDFMEFFNLTEEDLI